MLTSETLTQLSALKKEIRSSRNIEQGTVKGTSGKFGFVKLSDDRDIYLNPEQMERVLPGDVVSVEINENAKKQLEGKIEKLIHSPLKQVAGKYCIKGKGHFVIYRDGLYQRWFFVPPKERAKSEHDMLVTARISQHPFETGKAQAKITHKVSDNINANEIRRFTLAQHQLFDGFTKDVMDQTQSLITQPLSTQEEREDLTDKFFVTIDAANTRDMDDALYIEKSDNGWTLWVAIADPASEIKVQSALDKSAFRRGQTIYFPSKPLGMLPEKLATDRYSLIEGKERLALVTKIDIDTTGSAKDFTFIPACIISKAKLSYIQVSDLLQDSTEDNKDTENLETLQPLLVNLQACTNAVKKFREENQLVIEHKPDFYLKLNQQGKLESIDKVQRTPAHQIVEEAMIITNQCAGKLLSEKGKGIFSIHTGFKKERLKDAELLLKDVFQELTEDQLTSLEGYRTIIDALQHNETHRLLYSKQQRLQAGGQFSLESSPHFGLGCQYYANITSPIRRYQDLYNQRLIHSIISKDKATLINQSQLEKLQETNTNARAASRFMQQWLIDDFMQEKIGETFTAYIALLTNQGIGVRIVENGIEGFIPVKKPDQENKEEKSDKLSFNNQRLELTWNEKTFNLDQEIQVTLKAIDPITHKLELSFVDHP